MIIIQRLKYSTTGLTATVDIDGLVQTLEITIQQFNEDIRGMKINNQSDSEMYNLHNLKEFKEFERIVWQFVEGKHVCLPIKISSE